MRIAVEVVFDSQTKQWCVGMVAPPWIASCGSTRTEAKEKFLEAFHAYFQAPRIALPRSGGKASRRIELVTVA